MSPGGPQGLHAKSPRLQPNLQGDIPQLLARSLRTESPLTLLSLVSTVSCSTRIGDAPKITHTYCSTLYTLATFDRGSGPTSEDLGSLPPTTQPDYTAQPPSPAAGLDDFLEAADNCHHSILARSLSLNLGDQARTEVVVVAYRPTCFRTAAVETRAC